MHIDIRSSLRQMSDVDLKWPPRCTHSLAMKYLSCFLIFLFLLTKSQKWARFFPKQILHKMALDSEGVPNRLSSEFIYEPTMALIAIYSRIATACPSETERKVQCVNEAHTMNLMSTGWHPQPVCWAQQRAVEGNHSAAFRPYRHETCLLESSPARISEWHGNGWILCTCSLFDIGMVGVAVCNAVALDLTLETILTFAS